MGCQTTTVYDHKTHGFQSLFFLGENIKSSMCGIHGQFKNLIGGRKSRRRKRKTKRHYRRSMKRN